jgi:hypothetical protein
MCPINLWFEYQRIGAMFLDTPLQFAVQREVKLFTAMCTRGFKLDRKFLVT